MGHRLPDVGKELQLILNILRRIKSAVLQGTYILSSIDDLQMALVINDACVTSMNEPVFIQGLLGCLLVLIVT